MADLIGDRGVGTGGGKISEVITRHSLPVEDPQRNYDLLGDFHTPGPSFEEPGPYGILKNLYVRRRQIEIDRDRHHELGLNSPEPSPSKKTRPVMLS